MPNESLLSVVVEHQITVNGVELRCAVLNTGIRVVNAEDATRLFAVWATDEPIDEVGMERLASWLQGQMEH